ncbi:lysoplasmalogenase [Aliikangiella coralliicola]|nr:lysoplasmalogenase [Aliikangiella coralliicola]
MATNLGLLAISLTMLLFAEKKISDKQTPDTKVLQLISGLSKLMASLLFVYFFWANTAASNLFSISLSSSSSFGTLILLGLAFSFAGDLLLLPRGNSRFFLAGIGAFALAHIAYGFAFLKLLVEPDVILISTLLTLPAAAITYHWLSPHLTGRFRVLVSIYLGLISLMVIIGTAAGVSSNNYWIASGAIIFAVSDIYVARNRFVSAGFVNRLIGLPLYYSAQIMIAYGALIVIHGQVNLSSG